MCAHTSSEETVSTVLCFIREAFFRWYICAKTLGAVCVEGREGLAVGIVFTDGGPGVLVLPCPTRCGSI